jgi:PAS domain S-box-containing protein
MEVSAQITMATAATLSGAILDRGADRSLSWAKGALALSGLALVLGILISVWVFHQGFQSLVSAAGGQKEPVLQAFNNLVLAILVPAGLGGAVFLAAIGTGYSLLTKAHENRVQRQEGDCTKRVAAIQAQLAQARALGQALTEMAEEKAALGYTNAQLRTELDQIKKSERTLLWRRQQLESSKTVLEAHVQERSEELEKLQQQYELILNSAGEGICGLDLEGKAIFVNPAAARMAGCPVPELISKTEDEIFGQSDGDQPEVKPGERIIYRKDGTMVPVEYIKTPLTENARVVGAVLMFKDITQRKRVEEAIVRKAAELARSNAELEQFAFVASHDLQEPLRKIQAFGDRLKIKLHGTLPAEAQDYLDRMQSASARMRTLINDLLTFSRVIRSSSALVPVDLAKVTRDVLGDLEVRIEKSGALIDIGSLPVIEADPMQMHQLMLNLLGNALKFQPQNQRPVVKVSSRLYNTIAGHQWCELTVTDNGIGFEEKYLDKIFAVFQRLHGRAEFEGTGVGLAVCRRITDRHHGSIDAKSQLGKGASFIISLPVRQEQQQKADITI